MSLVCASFGGDAELLRSDRGQKHSRTTRVRDYPRIARCFFLSAPSLHRRLGAGCHGASNVLLRKTFPLPPPGKAMVRARFFYNKSDFRNKRKSSFTFAEGENFTFLPPPGKAYFGVAFDYQQTMFLTAVAPYRHSANHTPPVILEGALVRPKDLWRR